MGSIFQYFFSLGLTSIIPTPLPLMLEEQSTYNFQVGNIMDGYTRASNLAENSIVENQELGVSMCPLKQHSIMKSIKAWPFIVGWGLHWSLNSLNSIAHFTKHLNNFGLWRICLSGWSVNTITWWAWKYDFNFLELEPFFSLLGILF